VSLRTRFECERDGHLALCIASGLCGIEGLLVILVEHVKRCRSD
jgi:hypothetical protein